MSQPLPSLLRPCPICGAEDRKKLFKQRFSELDGALLNGYDVVICARCGFGFADRLPEAQAFESYYRSMSKYENQHRGGEEASHDRNRYRYVARVIRSQLKDDAARILDIGCSVGGLLAQLQALGFTNLQGLDPSPVCAETAKRLYGLRVLNHTLATFPASEGTFDLIIMAAVLEHLRDVKPALAKVRNLLNPQGKLFIEVPDASGFQKWPDAPFQQFSVEHINFFSPASLANLMRANGFVEVHRQQGDVENGPGSMAPDLCALFQKSENANPPIQKDTETEPALKEYIRQSEAVEKNIHAVINSLVASGRPVIVWGVGTHTQRLLMTSKLGQAKIQCFVDSNPRYQGKQFEGKPVVAPEALKGRSEAILISSRVFQNAICEQIRTQLKLSNDLITLYRL